MNNNSNKSILIIGPVSPKGIGDASQYYSSVNMCNELAPHWNLTLMIPDISNYVSVFKGLTFRTELIEQGDVGYLRLGGYIRYQQKGNVQLKHNDDNIFTKIISNISSYIPLFPIVDTELAVKRLKIKKFDGGIFGGHTFTLGAAHYIVKYNVIDKLVSGPKILSPISISKIGLNKLSKYMYHNIIYNFIKSLTKFDKIFVRGKYSYNILTEYYQINNVEKGLDTGFCLRKLYNKNNIFRNNDIVIIPRRGFFYSYNKSNLYKNYLKFLIKLINNFIKKGYKIVLSNQAMEMSSINDLLSLIKEKKLLDNIQISIPNNIIESYYLLSKSKLVITSYMHGGITAFCSNTPCVFIMPKEDTKVLDILESIKLNIPEFFIDIFSIKDDNYHLHLNIITNLLENNLRYNNIISNNIEKEYKKIYKPTTYLKKMLNS